MTDSEKLTPEQDLVILDGTEVTRQQLSESMKSVPAGSAIKYIKVNEQGLQEYRTLQRLLS